MTTENTPNPRPNDKILTVAPGSSIPRMTAKIAKTMFEFEPLKFFKELESKSEKEQQRL